MYVQQTGHNLSLNTTSMLLNIRILTIVSMDSSLLPSPLLRSILHCKWSNHMMLFEALSSWQQPSLIWSQICQASTYCTIRTWRINGPHYNHFLLNLLSEHNNHHTKKKGRHTEQTVHILFYHKHCLFEHQISPHQLY